ncbi:MAG: hypothetical protein JNJ40_11285 [Bacteroidia bacterium]|nr:hypothetical protein [Bacteroidia bacterium]
MLKIKKAIFLIFFFCSIKSSLLFSQSAAIKDNAINNSPNLTIGGTLLGVDIYDPNLNMFIEGKLGYRFKKEKAWIKANYTIAFADRLEEVTESNTSSWAVPAEGTKPLKTYGASIGFNLVRKEDFKLVKATFLKRSDIKSVKLPVKSYRSYGLHVGFDYFRSILAQGSTISFTGTATNFPKDTVLIASHATPMFSMNMITIGMHRQLVQHCVVQVNNGGELKEYKNKYISTFYTDFLIGTKMTFENILVPLNGNGPNANTSGGSYYSNDPYNFYSVDINGSYKKIPVGGRIGWEQIGLGPVGSIVGFEFGFRPGIINPADNIYLMMKIGMSFNMKAK